MSESLTFDKTGLVKDPKNRMGKTALLVNKTKIPNKMVWNFNCFPPLKKLRSTTTKPV
jgi:hypothetical protein